MEAASTDTRQQMRRLSSIDTATNETLGHGTNLDQRRIVFEDAVPIFMTTDCNGKPAHQPGCLAPVYFNVFLNEPHEIAPRHTILSQISDTYSNNNNITPTAITRLSDSIPHAESLEAGGCNLPSYGSASSEDLRWGYFLLHSGV